MNAPQRGDMRYEGKAKKVYATDEPGLYVVEYKDDATAFNAQKRGTIEGKGVVNNTVSSRLFPFLETAGVPTHFVRKLSDREQLVRAVEIVPLEVIVRNRAAGSFAKRYGVEEGGDLDPIVIEWCYKNDALNDPPINDAAAVALGFATPDELETMFELSTQVNDALMPFFEARGLELVDFKLEFGRTTDGALVLADEISPDTCRLWDLASGERLDKDRFRRDLGGVEEAYQEVMRRVLEEHPEGNDTSDAHEHGAHAHAADQHAAYVAHSADEHGTSSLRARPTGDGPHHAVVEVMLKRSILDPQGRAVEATLKRLGHDNVSGLRIGKRIELTLDGAAAAVEAQLADIAEHVLSNPVMEDVMVRYVSDEEDRHD
ncbi:MAG: phosphoribosylaminoimidazolesuccinocarboxamide synthase [Trueperaceae bacterium]